MVLYNIVIDKDVKMCLKGEGLGVKLLFPDNFYNVDVRFPKASARWRNKLTVDHLKTKATQKYVTELIKKKLSQRRRQDFLPLRD